MEKWKPYKLGDIVMLKRGYDLPDKERIKGKFPIISSSGISGHHNQYKIEGPCVVTGRYGTLGLIHYSEGKCWPLNTTLYVKDFKGNNPRFVYYFLKTLHLEEFNGASAVPGLDRNVLHRIKCLFPSNLHIQQQIGSILSSYDDLIEVNNQRIRLLGETARELYKEWFVRMRFPGYKNAKFLRGIPEKWELNKLSDLVSTQYGYTASAVNDEMGPRFLRITDIADTIINWNDVPHCLIPEKELNKYLLQFGDVVVARTGATVGFAKRLNKFHPPTVFASYLVRLKPRNIIFNYYLGVIIESDDYKEYIQAVAGGAAQPQANANLMTRFSLLKPDDSIIERFNSIIEPIFDQREVLLKQNIHLMHIRNRLLPRLISGRLHVRVNSKSRETVGV